MAVPVLSWIAVRTGRELVLYQPMAHTELTAIAVCVLSSLTMQKSVRLNRLGLIGLYIALPAVLWGGFDLLQRARDMLEILCALICAAAVWCAYRRHAQKGSAARIAVSVLSTILTAALIFWAMVSMLFMDFGVEGSSLSVASPDGTKVASTYFVDQGGLGGDEYLEIRESGEGINVIVGRLRKMRRYELDVNDWNPEGRQIEWLGEESVLVDGKRYDLSERDWYGNEGGI